MKTLLLLSILLFGIAGPVHAMTEESSHYQGADARANATDDDEGEEQFNDPPRGNYLGQGAREQELLQGGAQDHGTTYGFGSYDNSWTQSSGSNGQSGFYYGIH